MYTFLEREIPLLLERWEKERASLLKSSKSA
jgi:hypothetical protein